jgi:CBS domain-containing protein
MTYERTVRQVPPDHAVNSLMSWPVTTVETTDSLVEVARALAADEIGEVLVLRRGVLVGVVTARDLAVQLGRGTDPNQLTAGDVMSTHLVTVPPEAPVLEAARIMQEAGVRHVPVVSDDEIAGVLSLRDVFNALLGHVENALHDPQSPAPHLETTTWRHYQRALWLLTCPLCGRETDQSGP